MLRRLHAKPPPALWPPSRRSAPALAAAFGLAVAGVRQLMHQALTQEDEEHITKAKDKLRRKLSLLLEQEQECRAAADLSADDDDDDSRQLRSANVAEKKQNQEKAVAALGASEEEVASGKVLIEVASGIDKWPGWAKEWALRSLQEDPEKMVRDLAAHHASEEKPDARFPGATEEQRAVICQVAKALGFIDVSVASTVDKSGTKRRMLGLGHIWIVYDDGTGGWLLATRPTFFNTAKPGSWRFELEADDADADDMSDGIDDDELEDPSSSDFDGDDDDDDDV